MKIEPNDSARERLGFARLAQPGAVISNAWPQSRATEGATQRAIEEVLARFPFFEAFQTVDVPFAAERKAIRSLLGDRGFPHTYALTRVLGERKLSLSSLDPDNRRQAVATVIAQFDEAIEAGAGTVAVISGARPSDPAQRTAALEALEESLAQLSAAATQRGIALVIEPLDHSAHKCQTLGTTREAVGICRRLAARNLPLSLCLDTAHLILNDEPIIPAVDAARAFIAEFHFCNPVTDRNSPLFGDQHVPFGPPGAMGADQIASLLADLRDIRFLDAERRPRIYCEVMKPAGMDSLAVIAHCRDALVNGWAAAQQSRQSS